MNKIRNYFVFVFVLSLLSGCSFSSLFQPPTSTVDLPGALTSLARNTTAMPESSLAVEPDQPASTLIPTQTAEPEKTFLWVSPFLPRSITQGLVAPVVMEQVEDREAANLFLDISEEGRQVTSLVFALVAPFPTLVDEVSLKAIKNTWQGSSTGETLAGTLFLTQHTKSIFAQWWGNPAGDFFQVIPQEDLLEATWAQPKAWALLPFEELRPEWKVMEVDGSSPIWKEFDPAAYPLTIPVSFQGENPIVVDQMAEALNALLPATYNRDPNSLTTVVLTGVTALVRATATEMEEKGVLHPAEQVAPLLQSADILHISNEVPFASTCPPPTPVNFRLVFCSADKYMELLEYIGTDVVELTGDHFSDWGVEATLHTFDLYEAEGWAYYGGGRTPEQGRLPITFEHNGNKIAFIGCNGKGGSYTPSTRGAPGAVDCDFALISSEISRLKQEGYTVIMTFQHHEVYSFTPSPYLVTDFQFTADAGADIVSGSQAHQPHGMSFYNGSMIMYGLGNLFFDQLLIGENTSRALIARHVIYRGRHISTEVFTIHFTDFSRPLYLEGEDRNRLLRQVFEESDWGELTDRGFYY